MAGYYLTETYKVADAVLALATLVLDPTAVLPDVAIVVAPASAARAPRAVQDSGDAYLGASWLDDYFGRVHLTPPVNDFGVVASPVERTLRIWNARLTAVTLDDLLGSNDDGLSFTGLGTLPITLQPTEERIVTHVAVETGSPIIEASYIFEFSTENMYYAATGLRARVFPHEPDWSDPVQVSRRWKTLLQEGLTGDEIRQSVATRALRDLEFRVLALDATEAEGMRELLLILGKITVGVPLWTETTWLSAPAVSGQTVLSVEVVDSLALDASFVILWQSWRNWEVRRITSSTSNTVTLGDGLVNAWATGTRVVPILFGRLASLPTLGLVTDDDVSTALSFEEEF